MGLTGLKGIYIFIAFILPETGAVGLDPQVGTEADVKHRNEHQFPMSMTEINYCVKTEAENERLPKIAGNCYMPLDLSLPKNITPDTTTGLVSASHDVAIQTERSTFDCGTTRDTRYASTQTQISHSCHKKPLVKILQPVAFVRKSRFCYRPDRSATQLALLSTIHHLTNQITEMESRLLK